MVVLNQELVEEYKARLADRFTAAELVELMDLPTEDIIESWWEYILEYHGHILKEVGLQTVD